MIAEAEATTSPADPLGSRQYDVENASFEKAHA
jgi:hypothetical protein